MENKKIYFKCPKCELNYVEEEGKLCAVCNRQRVINYYANANPFNNKYRLTCCYSCHTPLDSRTDMPCPECHWIICPNCNACGCQQKRN